MEEENRPAKVKIISFDGKTVEFDFDEHRLKTGAQCAGLLIKVDAHRWQRIATPGEIALPDDDAKVITALLSRYPDKIREFIARAVD